MTAVGVKDGANIPTVKAVRGPGLAFGWFFMGDNSTSRGPEGGPIKIKGTVDLGPGR